jgi:hypothetical protein
VAKEKPSGEGILVMRRPAGGNACDEGNMRPQANEALGELQARIDMALGRICYDEEAKWGRDMMVWLTGCDCSVKMGLVCSNYKTCKLRSEDAEGVMTFAVTIWRTA